MRENIVALISAKADFGACSQRPIDPDVYIPTVIATMLAALRRPM